MTKRVQKIQPRRNSQKRRGGSKSPAWKSGVCRRCGCMDYSPCPGGCAWVDRTCTLCTACVAPLLRTWEAALKKICITKEVAVCQHYAARALESSR